MGKRSHPMDTFRKNKKSGHPAYVYRQKGNYFEYIGITHDAEGTIPLYRNPEPGNKSKAHIKRNPEQMRTTDLEERLPGWKFDPRDLPKVEKVKKREVKKGK